MHLGFKWRNCPRNWWIKNCRVQMMLILCGHKITFLSVSHSSRTLKRRCPTFFFLLFLPPPAPCSTSSSLWLLVFSVWTRSCCATNPRSIDCSQNYYSFRSCLLPIIRSRGQRQQRAAAMHWRRMWPRPERHPWKRLLAGCCNFYCARSVQIN